MLFLSFLAVVLFGKAIATPNITLTIRDDPPPGDAELLGSCPGGSGSDLKKADKCTLDNVTSNPDAFGQQLVIPSESICGGNDHDVSLTVGGSMTVEKSQTLDVNVGVEIGPINIGGGFSTTTDTTVTKSKSTTLTVSPGHQVIQVAGTVHKSQTGRVQVNYGSKVRGHFIFFTGARVTQLTPTDNVAWDVHDTPCDGNLNDLSGFPTTP